MEIFVEIFLFQDAVLCNVPPFQAFQLFFYKIAFVANFFFATLLKRTLKDHLQHEESYQIPIHCSLETSKTIFSVP